MSTTNRIILLSSLHYLFHRIKSHSCRSKHLPTMVSAAISSSSLLLPLVLFVHGRHYIYIIHKQAPNMSAIFPERSHRHYKSNKIWTDICWDVADIPSSWLSTKFSIAMDTVPFPEKWITFIPTDKHPSFVDKYLAAGFGTTSIEEHKQVIGVLSDMHKKDRFAFTHIVIIDARHSVIGSDIDDDHPIPFLVNHEILRDHRIHRNPEDGPDDEHYLTNAKLKAQGNVQSTKTHIGYREYKIFQCRESTMVEDRYLKYCRCQHQSISQTLSYYDTMQQVHNHHIQWLLKSRDVPRECYNSLHSTYQLDKLLEERTRKRMVKILQLKLSSFERTIYGVGSPSNEWYDSCFSKRMEIIHDEHKQWLLDQSHVTHVHHCRFLKIYTNDIFMSEDTKCYLTNILNTKFGDYIASLHDEPNTLIKKTAHRYWIEKIPVVTPVMAPLLPFDCW